MLILLFWGIVIYLVITLFVAREFVEEAYEMILWPLVFIKYMLKGLFKVLFTGWRD